ncbi:MAG: DCC1-like thiol-disulfide oxidoreductase family protein [Bacteroidota bacterium]
MNKALIYDDNCPLCVWYTGLFVKSKLLEKRIAFSEVKQEDLVRIDQIRSKHEIPLLDLKGGDTLYGLDSLVEVLQSKLPFLKTLMRIPFVHAFFYWLYQLISYNRRLIVGKKGCNNGFDCTPDFNLKFRSHYLIASILAAFIIYAIFSRIVAFPMIWMMLGLLCLSTFLPCISVKKPNCDTYTLGSMLRFY